MAAYEDRGRSKTAPTHEEQSAAGVTSSHDLVTTNVMPRAFRCLANGNSIQVANYQLADFLNPLRRRKTAYRGTADGTRIGLIYRRETVISRL